MSLREIASTRFTEVFRRPSGGLQALDGLRAISVLLIIFFHASAWVEVLGSEEARIRAQWTLRTILGQLWIGVDVFFALSGFLIGRILLRQAAAGRIDLRAFYVRRFVRILPAYYVVLLVTAVGLSHLAVFAHLYGLYTTGDIALGVLKDVFFVNNYFRSHPEILGWGWSICVEQHFYLVLPALLGVLFRWPPGARLLALAVLPALPMLSRAAMYLADRSITLWDGPAFYSHTRCDGLLYGVLLSYLDVFHKEQLRAAVSKLRWPLLLLAAAGFLLFLDRGGVFVGGRFGVVGQLSVVSLAIAIVTAVSLAVDGPLTAWLKHPVWYPIARVSYGMYLLHPLLVPPLFTMLGIPAFRILNSAPGLVLFCLLVSGACFVLAIGLFVTVELPMLRWGARVAGTSRVPVDPMAERAATLKTASLN